MTKSKAQTESEMRTQRLTETGNAETETETGGQHVATDDAYRETGREIGIGTVSGTGTGTGQIMTADDTTRHHTILR
jgi:hypothetical protein